MSLSEVDRTLLEQWSGFPDESYRLPVAVAIRSALRSLDEAAAARAQGQPTQGEGWREAANALAVAKSLMMASGWWIDAAGYKTDAARWIDRALAALASHTPPPSDQSQQEDGR